MIWPSMLLYYILPSRVRRSFRLVENQTDGGEFTVERPERSPKPTPFRERALGASSTVE